MNKDLDAIIQDSDVASEITLESSTSELRLCDNYIECFLLYLFYFG